jgi:hypothetical protein
VSNAPKCPLNNCVIIVQKVVVKLKLFKNVFATGGNNVVETSDVHSAPGISIGLGSLFAT